MSTQPNSPILYAALACSVALNLLLMVRGCGSTATPQETATAPAAPTAEPGPGLAKNVEVGIAEEVADQAAQGASVVEPKAQPSGGHDWQVLRGAVEQSLPRTFQKEAGEDGDALASVFARLVVWDLDLRRDLQAGDRVAAVWRMGADGKHEIAAATLFSQKKGRGLDAFRWQAPGDTFASYWRLDGTEVPFRLKESPLADYEQITSLLKDRPTHKGMDFKTPVGTEVLAPKAGTVTRANWNWNANGNGIEIRFEDGVLAKFLHLSENRVKAGDRVNAGQVIALSGNTGRSTAPHLHYQLDRGDKTLDPLDYHGSTRRTLSPEQVTSLRAAVGDLEATLRGTDGSQP